MAALAYVLVGVLTTVILAKAKSVFEHSGWGTEFEFWAFGVLQGSLSNFDPKSPVVLIDISDVPEESDVVVEKVGGIVQTLKALQEPPRAIGVDIDFSPTGVVSDDTIKFFDACLKRDNYDVPIYLAVGKNKSAPPEARLGLEKYKDLAAAVAIQEEDTRRIPVWVQPSNQTEKFKTINYLLALEYRRQLPGPPSWISPMVDRSEDSEAYTHERQETDPDEIVLNYGERLVNYSKLEVLKATAKKDIDAQSVRNNATTYKGKLVIIGDVTAPRDPFPVPGFRVNQAGSLLLASATYTLVKEPLFSFKRKVHLFLDLFIAGVIIAMVAIIRYRNPEDLSWRGKQAKFIYISILVVAIVGFSLVRWAGVMWLDFFLVAFALLLHPTLEHLFHGVWIKLRNRTVCLFMIFVIVAPTFAQEPGSRCHTKVAAIALQLKKNRRHKQDKRTCDFRENEEATWKQLSEADMGSRLFLAGQDLRCDKGCSLLIYLCGTRNEYWVKKEKPKWERLANPWRKPGSVRDRNEGIPARKIKTSPANPSTSAAARVRHEDAWRGVTVVRGIDDTGAHKERRLRFAALLAEANALRDAKKYSEAERTYASAARLMPTDSRALYGLGNVYVDQEQWNKAEEAYQRAIRLWPGSAEVYLALAILLKDRPSNDIDSDRLSQAETYLWTAASIQQKNEIIYRHLYSLLEKKGAGTLEFEALNRRILTLNPRSFSANFRLSQKLRQLGQLQEARKHLEIAAKAAAEPDELLDIADVFEHQGRYSEAERLATRALQLSPYEPRADLILAIVLIERNRPVEAIGHLKSAADMMPEDFAPRHLLGIAYLGNGKLDEAEQSFLQAASKLHSDADQLFATAYWLGLLGDAFLTEDRSLDAERVYKKALEYDPADREIKQKLSRIHLGRNP